MVSGLGETSSRSVRGPSTPARLAALSFLGVVFAFGCSDDATGTAGNGGGATGGTGGETASQEVFLFGVQLPAPDGTAAGTFAGLVSGPLDDPSAEFPDLSEFLEFPGGQVFGLDGESTVYMSSLDSRITEIVIGEDGSLTPGRVISFASLGVTNTFSGNLVLSPTKAYHLSGEIGEIVVWNPQTMEITGTIPLGLTVDDGFAFRSFRVRTFRVGDLLVWPSFQGDQNSISGTGPEVGFTLTVIDTQTDQVVSNTVEPRANGFFTFAQDAAGDRYFATASLNSSWHQFVPDRVPEPIILRIRAGETSFDPDWERSLTNELGTSIWAGILPGAGNTMYVQGLPEDDPLVEAAQGDGLVLGDQAWPFFQLEEGPEVGDPVPVDLGFEGSIFFGREIDDDVYFQGFLPETEQSFLINMTSEGGPQEGLLAPGIIRGIVRVR